MRGSSRPLPLEVRCCLLLALAVLGCERGRLDAEPPPEPHRELPTPDAAPDRPGPLDGPERPDARATPVIDAGTDAATATPACRSVNPADNWLGCNAGCALCGDLLRTFDLYQQHHPRCTAAATSCAGEYRACSADCPLPTHDDISCRPRDDGWRGCVGSGCIVDPAAVAAYPGYFRSNRICQPGTTTGAAARVGCAAVCPPPTEADKRTYDGSPGGWQGCRGYGRWACVELLGDYPLYFENHPLCIPNSTCDGQFYTCNDVCPPPGPADRARDPMMPPIP